MRSGENAGRGHGGQADDQTVHVVRSGDDDPLLHPAHPHDAIAAEGVAWLLVPPVPVAGLDDLGEEPDHLLEFLLRGGITRILREVVHEVRTGVHRGRHGIAPVAQDVVEVPARVGRLEARREVRRIVDEVLHVVHPRFSIPGQVRPCTDLDHPDAHLPGERGEVLGAVENELEGVEAGDVVGDDRHLRLAVEAAGTRTSGRHDHDADRLPQLLQGFGRLGVFDPDRDLRAAEPAQRLDVVRPSPAVPLGMNHGRGDEDCDRHQERNRND